jgi:endoglucanase
MPGGVCEASAYLAYGYESTCVCLPLGNYHNMADLAAVADEKDEQAIANARVGREFVAMDDYHDLVTLLTAVALSLAESEPMTDRLDRLHRQRERILTDPTLFTPDVFTSTEPI